MPLPQILCLSPEDRDKCCPSTPCRSCRLPWGLPSVSSRLNKPRSLSHSSYILTSRPLIIFVAILWTLAGSFMSFLYCGAQTVLSAWGEAASQCRENNPFPLPAGGASPDEPHSAISPYGSRAHCWFIQFAVKQNPQASSLRSTLQSLIPQFVHISRVALSQMKN